MWITRTSIDNPVFATMAMAALVVLGLFSYRSLGVDQMPDVQPPYIFVDVRYPGASPEAVENDISKPIENAVNSVSGIKTLRSNAYEGRSQTVIELDLSANLDRAVQDVRDKLALIRPGFPKEAKEPLVGRANTDNAQPVVALALTSSGHSLRDLSTLTEQVIVKRFQAVTGVAQVNVGGAVSRQILINLRPAQMAAQSVGVDEVLAAIQATNQDVPAGILTRSDVQEQVRIESRMKDPRAFGRIIVARRGGAPIYLEQVAEVVDGEREEQSISRMNGERAINLWVLKTQDANIIEVGDGIKAAAEELTARLPADVKLQVIYANSDWVKASIAGVKKTILEGAGLTVLIVFLFLHSWRSTIITGLTLPIAVFASFIAMHACGFTLNFLTLMALSLCIGFLIDDAIVVRENIVRHLGMGKSHYAAAKEGTEEIGLAVMATTFAIVAVFVPVAFMQGIIGRFFFQFGITVTVAVLVSLFVSFTLDPMLSSVWRDPVGGRFRRLPWLGWLMAAIESVVEKTHAIYGRVLAQALDRRRTTLIIASAVFFGSFLLLPLIGTEFVPAADEGYIGLKAKTPPGSSLAYTNAKVRQVEDVLKSFPELEMISATVGNANGPNEADFILKLTDRKVVSRRTQKQVEESIRERMRRIPGLQLSVGWVKPIQLAVLGPEADRLGPVVDEIMQKLSAIKGITELESSLTGANPAITLRVNHQLASDLGLSVQQIGSALRTFVAGETVSHWLAPDGQDYEVNVQLPRSGRQRTADLDDLSIASSRNGPDGKPIMVPLRQVVEFVPSSSPKVINRQDLQRRAVISANVEGRPAGDVGTEVEQLTKSIKLPPGYRFDIGGDTKFMQESFSAALAALGIAVVFIYLILASQFGSFLPPLAIMASLPLSLIGVFLALLVTRSTLNIFSIIGFIMLMGLVTKNAILLVDFITQGQRQGMSQRDAILSSGQVRLRPILMTSLAMIFGMLPMALGLGDAEQQASMGRAVIGGIITSTLLTLVVVPVTYTYLDDWGRKVTAWLRRRQAAVEVASAADAS